ncbi:MAG: serine acetyltransferase, partial [Variovorax sp.]|nr:serine acetyltransferase [Variovorax sp.]
MKEQQEYKEALWPTLVRQAHALRKTSPVLAPDLDALVLERTSFADALCAVLSGAMSTAVPASIRLDKVFCEVLQNDPDIAESAAVDLEKLASVNPACPDMLTGLLSVRGFQALQLHRIDHALWKSGQTQLAVLLQNWGAIRYAMDIHPA